MQHIEAFRQAAEKTAKEDVLKKLFSKAVKEIGYHGFDAFSLHVDTHNNANQPGNFFICDYDLGVISSFIFDGWLQMDPVMSQAAKTSQPFDYVEHLKNCTPNSSVKWQLRILKGFNVNHAWIIPFNVIDATRGVTCYMRGNGPAVQKRFQETRHQVQLLSGELIGRLEQMKMQSVPERKNKKSFPPLSAREVDCLHWTARGKTNAEISVILEVSQNTVSFHMKNLFRKLNVRTRSHAVLIATQSGFINA